jgi:hypothetical protein
LGKRNGAQGCGCSDRGGQGRCSTGLWGRAGASSGCWLGKIAEDGAVPHDVEPEEGCTEEDDAPGAEQVNRAALGLGPWLGVEGRRRAGVPGARRRSEGAGARRTHEAEGVRGRNRARENWGAGTEGENKRKSQTAGRGARPAVHRESSRALEGRWSRVWTKSSAQGEG